MTKAEDAWRHYGEHDPYYGVLTHDKFRSGRLTADAIDEFVRSGEAYVKSLLAEIEREHPGGFVPRRGLDFGCGVGRLTIPLARWAGHMTGVDVSSAMLAEAERNARRQGSGDNIRWVESSGDLSAIGPVDFVHSYIVLQHMTVADGMAVLGQQLDLLETGGIGVIHIPFRTDGSMVRRALHEVFRRSPRAWRLRNRIQRVPDEPMMLMSLYDLNRVLGQIRDAGCDRVSVRYVEHDTTLGVALLFKKL